MSKRKKKDVHKIDMSARLSIEVISASQTEIEYFEQELKEIELSVERRMRQYEEELKKMMLEIANEEIITATEQDSLYFIETYDEFIRNRNKNNIKNRLEKYQLLLKEQESN